MKNILIKNNVGTTFKATLRKNEPTIFISPNEIGFENALEKRLAKERYTIYNCVKDFKTSFNKEEVVKLYSDFKNDYAESIIDKNNSFNEFSIQVIASLYNFINCNKNKKIAIFYPETCMHIDEQEKFINCILNFCKQVVIFTHSPDIISTHDDLVSVPHVAKIGI